MIVGLGDNKECSNDRDSSNDKAKVRAKDSSAIQRNK